MITTYNLQSKSEMVCSFFIPKVKGVRKIATTGIWKIEKRLDNVIDYTTNIEKTINSDYGKDSYYDLHNVIDYVEADYKTEKQFSACVFSITDSLYYIGYRGTDASFVGWKEDLNLGYLDVIPSQKEALDYFVNFASKYDGTYIIGGHSKGGNLAVYAATFAPTELKAKIKMVYSHDGPGFLPNFYKTQEFENIQSRICKIIPKAAVVGLIMEQYNNYKVVNSKAVLLLQHDLLKWQIVDDHLDYVSDVNKFSKHTRKIMNSWISDMDMETRKVFVNTIYELIVETKAERISQFLKNWPKNLVTINKKVKDLDPQVRKCVLQAFNEFFKLYIKRN